MRALKSIGFVAIVLVVAGLVYKYLLVDARQPESALQNSEDVATDDFAVSSEKKAASTTGNAVIEQPSFTANSELVQSEPDAGSNSPLSSSYPPLAAYEIGNEPLTDDGLIELVNRLNNDPELLADLISDLRAESDPARMKRLVIILGATGNSAVLPAAEEMVYSGIPDSRTDGLDLLNRLAPSNPEAMTIASSLLVSETEPDVLVATMNVMAQPSNASPELRESLVTQLKPLSGHESAKVRSLSVNILSRLSEHPDLSPVFYNALLDAESSVRSSAVFAFAKFPYHTVETSQKLLDMAEDQSEDAEIRRGAIFALSKNSPDEQTAARLDEIKLEIRRQIRANRRNGN